MPKNPTISDAKRRQLETARAKAVAARKQRLLLRLKQQIQSLQEDAVTCVAEPGVFQARVVVNGAAASM